MAILRMIQMTMMLILLIFSGQAETPEARACLEFSAMQREGGARGRGLVVGSRCGREMLDRVAPGGPDPQHHAVPPWSHN